MCAPVYGDLMEVDETASLCRPMPQTCLLPFAVRLRPLNLLMYILSGRRTHACMRLQGL